MALNRLSTCTLLAGLVLTSACGSETSPGEDSDPNSTLTTVPQGSNDDDDDGTTGSDGTNSGSSGSHSGSNSGTHSGTNSGSSGSHTTTGSNSDTGTDSDSTTTTTEDPCLFPRIECDGTCIDPNSDPVYCGASGDCSSDKGTICQNGQVCSNGECKVECDQGLVLCSGACVDPLSDNVHCGAKLDCSLPDNAGTECTGATFCSNGTCVAACAANEVLCNGTCVNPLTDANFCGASGLCDTDAVNGEVCPVDQVCSNGMCKVDCDAGSVKCDGECVDPLSDQKYCGAKAPCDIANNGEACLSNTVCTNGECKAECDAGLVKCNGNCINPKDNVDFCGAKEGCVDAVACNTGDVCIDGMCKPESSCVAPKVQCGADCIDPKTDSNHCGADINCANGTICDGTKDLACIDGTCQLSCTAEEVKCGNECINPQDNEKYCGAKPSSQGGTCSAADDGVQCTPTEICSAGVCINNCPGSTPLACGGTCIDPKTNESYCGAVAPCDAAHDGETCESGKKCIDGACRIECPTGQVECNGACIDPLTDESFCGAKLNCVGANDGNKCTGEQQCVNGACDLSCTGSKADWVECTDVCVNPNDAKSCGLQPNCTGGKTCGASEKCDDGNCVLNCPAGQVNCEGSCIDPKTSEKFCGVKADCTGGDWCIGEECINSVCTLVCPAGQIQCGNDCVNPNTSMDHCGATAGCTGSSSGKACDPNIEKCENKVCVSNGCGSTTTLGTPDPAGVMLVLDKSGSMVLNSWNNGGVNETRWATLHKIVESAGLTYAPDGGTNADVHFGVQLFPKRDSGHPTNWDNCKTGVWPISVIDGTGCGVVNPELLINSVNRKTQLLNAIPPENSLPFYVNDGACDVTANWDTASERNRAIFGATPTSSAMSSVKNNIATGAVGPDGKRQKRVALLITDGEQSTSCGSIMSTLDHVTQMNSAGIKTYVIGIALNATGRTQIQNIAAAGGTAPKEATQPDALKSIFDEILQDIVSCKITLNPTPAYPDDVHVYFPDVPPTEIPYRAGKTKCADVTQSTGWIYSNAAKTEIEFCNDSCKQFKIRREVNIERECPGQD